MKEIVLNSRKNGMGMLLLLILLHVLALLGLFVGIAKGVTVLIILSSTIEYLITPAKVSLSTDTVFYNAETGDIKIAYVPVQEEPAGTVKNLLKFISQLKADVIDEYKEYLDQFALLVFRNNYHMRELTSRIGLMRRELYLRTSASS